MNTRKTSTHASARRAGIGTAAILGVAAVSLALGSQGAFAAESISTGSYDAIEVGIDGGQLVVGGHDHGTDQEFDPSTVTFVSDVADASNGGYTIAESGGPLSLGLAAEADVFDAGVDDIGLTISNFSGPGDLEVWEDGQAPIFDTASSDLDETLPLDFDNDEGEAYHQHYSWNFTQAGTYTFDVVAADALGGVSDSAPVSYTFDIG